ncbi:MAG: peptidoglycan editing factor PgeF [Lachnospiraceae bacterium]|nr:peptidoglycan editing factor PgeF [Lachnospiraceae bacterium]
MAVFANHFGSLEYLTAEGILVPHCFTTRYGGVSTGHFDSMNLGQGRGDSEDNVNKNFHILAGALGVSWESLVLTRQTHSNIVRVVTKADHAGLDHRGYPECDALITQDPGTGLVIFTADCTPVLLWDPVTGAVGAAHAGWRGTADGIAAKTVDAMVENFGCRPKDICAAIGPNIGACCFQTDADVPEAMIKAFGSEVERFVRFDGEKYYSDLKAINALALRRAGVKQIELSTDCTMCQHDRFWSHRYTRGVRGSQGALIVCR